MQTAQQHHPHTPEQPADPRPLLVTALTQRLLAVPPWVLLVQLFIGLGWTRAGVEKLISADWWTGEYLRSFLIEHADETVAWYIPFANLVVWPGAVAISVVVIALQFLVGAALLLNRRTGLALAVGIFLNLNFIAVGAVNPSAFYLLAQGAVLLWMAERTKEGWVPDFLERIMTAGLVLAMGSVPWIRTLHPEHVIDDPALMLVTAGGLASLCSFLAIHKLKSR